MGTLEKILCVFFDVEMFARMLAGEKYALGYRYRYQFGGHCIEVERDAINIGGKMNLSSRASCMCAGYDIVLDDFLKRIGVFFDEGMSVGYQHLKFKQMASSLRLGPDDDGGGPQMTDVDKRLIDNWNKLIAAVEKYR